MLCVFSVDVCMLLDILRALLRFLYIILILLGDGGFFSFLPVSDRVFITFSFLCVCTVVLLEMVET